MPTPPSALRLVVEPEPTARTRLYRVVAEVDIFVMAADPHDAEMLAERHLRDEQGNVGYTPMLLRPVDRAGLTRDALATVPWGAPDDRSVSALLEQEIAAAEVERRQCRLPFAPARP